MDDAELLNGIKVRLGITGDYHDGLLLAYAQDVKDYMLSGGVTPRVINGSTSIGCIARGVADLWNYGSGEGKFSEVFYQRVIQLALPIAGMEDGSEDFDEIPEDDIDEVVGGTGEEPEPEYEEIESEEIDEVVGPEPEPEEPEYATPGDIDDVVDGTYQEPDTEEPSDPEPDEEYEELTEEEIDSIL